MNNFNSVCRLCAELKSKSELTYLEDDAENFRKISMKLVNINAKIDFDDNNLPKSVCTMCLSLLDSAFQFVTTISLAQEAIKLSLVINTKENEKFVPKNLTDIQEHFGPVIPIDHKDLGDNCNPIEIKGEGCYTEQQAAGLKLVSDPEHYTSDINLLTDPNSSNNDGIGDSKNYNTLCKSQSDCTDDESSQTCSEDEVKDTQIKKIVLNYKKLSDLKYTWKDYNWKCSLCKEIFPTCDDLTNHSMNQHSLCNTYSCNDCNATRRRLNFFLKHVQEHYEDLAMCCFKCDQTFQSSEFSRHINRHNTSKHVCPGCITSFPTAEELIKHKDLFYRFTTRFDLPKLDESTLQTEGTWASYRWKCIICKTQFENSDELITHSIEIHKRCNTFSCLECTRQPLKIDCFIKHVQQKHRRYLTRSCYKCNKQFGTLTLTNKHRLIHKTSKFMCEGCNTCFTNAAEYTKHKDSFFRAKWKMPIPKEFGDMSDGLSCTVCNKTSRTQKALHNHLWTHMDRPKDHVCDICGKKFALKYHLQKHMAIHDPTLKIRCEICNTGFLSQNHLRYHVAIHGTEKAFQCEHCDKSFTRKNYLHNHLLTHQDTSFTCTICNKSFKRPQYLKMHMRQHTGVKSYCCGICPREFVNWANYNKHMKRKHDMDMAKRKRGPDEVKKKLESMDDKLLAWKEKVSKPLYLRKKRVIEKDKEPPKPESIE